MARAVRPAAVCPAADADHRPRGCRESSLFGTGYHFRYTLTLHPLLSHNSLRKPCFETLFLRRVLRPNTRHKTVCLTGERGVSQKRSFLIHRGTRLLASHTIPIVRIDSPV